MTSNQSKINSKVFKTQRNKEKILYNGFIYVKDYATSIIQYWRCEQRKCKGRLATSPSDVISKIEVNRSRNHLVFDEDIKKAIFEEKTK